MWNDAAEVAVVVDALLFLGQVPGPVLVEVCVIPIFYLGLAAARL